MEKYEHLPMKKNGKEIIFLPSPSEYLLGDRMQRILTLILCYVNKSLQEEDGYGFNNLEISSRFQAPPLLKCKQAER